MVYCSHAGLGSRVDVVFGSLAEPEGVATCPGVKCDRSHSKRAGIASTLYSSLVESKVFSHVHVQTRLKVIFRVTGNLYITVIFFLELISALQ